MPKAFDIQRAIAESGLQESTVARILKEVEDDFQPGELMYELHCIRALDWALYETLGPDAWLAHIRKRSAESLKQLGFEEVDSPDHAIRAVAG